jgi:signal transduction histidine kinase
VLDENEDRFRIAANHGMPEELVHAVQSVPARSAETLASRATLARAPRQIADVEAETSYGFREVVLRAGIRALLAVPLLREERVVGAIVLLRRRPGAFTQETVDLLQSFAGQAALAIHNAKLYRELQEKGRELEAASRHKSEFLANMSHELRTPLNAILGFTELVLDGVYGPPPAKIAAQLERVQANGRHLLGLINDVLDLSKIEAGRLELELADFAPAEVVASVQSTTESLARAKGLAFRVRLPPRLPRAHGDARRITQVLLNLVGNAIKFTEAGEVLVEVTADADGLELAVADTGPGIPLAEQARIFEEFHQVDSSSTRRQGGTGLGLAIARRIVELHGGSIGVESTPGRGSRFTVRLPLRARRRQAA